MNPDEIPEMKSNSPGSTQQNPIDPKEAEKMRKEMEKTKEKLEKLKEHIIKTYKFTEAIGILPMQSIQRFIEEENIDKSLPPEEIKKIEKFVHLFVIVPENKFKEIKKIKEEIVQELKKTKENIWVHVKTPVDVFEYGLDSKFDLTSAVALSYPLFDKGILGALRVAEIHKSLILRKFEKYVTSYVLAGSITRGEAQKASDVDVYVIIDDTDVKRMPRVELKEKLRRIIYDYVIEAGELAGVKNKLSPQVYLLTDFWESVKDAHPVMFTFIRDGVPLHDRGTFLPWKALLKMGKIKPSPEAIDSFMSWGDKVIERAKKALLDIVTLDLYWAVITPTQAVLMLYGLPPPAPKHVVAETKKYLVEKEKLLEKKYLDTLERVVTIYKDWEHQKIKEIKGSEIDKFLKDVEEYIKRLKELEEQIRKRTDEKTIEQISEDLTKLMKGILGDKPQNQLVHVFEEELVKKGKMLPRSTSIIKDVFAAKEQFKKGKLDKNKVEEIRKNASIVINNLIDYTQRCEIADLYRGKVTIKYKENKNDKFADVIVTPQGTFFIKEKIIYKITERLEPSSQAEFEKAIQEKQANKKLEADRKIFDVIKKALGDFEIVF
jgi:predicted nucleotidyltransferase/uncharacterized protein (UPF0332 family)